MPHWGFGTAGRMASDKPKYDFYENAMFQDDPLTADITRKKRVLAPKIGTEPRVRDYFYNYILTRCKEAH